MQPMRRGDLHVVATDRRRPGRVMLAGLIGLSLVLGSCAGTGGSAGRNSGQDSDGAGGAGTPTTGAPIPTAAPIQIDADKGYVPVPIVWEPAGAQTDTAVIAVPIDYQNPSAGSIDLYIARHRATDPAKRIGALLVNQGGPGFGSSWMALSAPRIYDAALIERFDIIAWDPRGTGISTPAIDCIDDYDAIFGALDGSPDPQTAAVELAQEFAEACRRNNAEIITHVGTNNSARDMDAIRQALGEDQISYFGFSYGSELGGTWATLFPETVRAAVLDGASDPNADRLQSSLQQIAGFEASVGRFLAACSANSTCAIHNRGDAEGFFDRLMRDLADSPVTSLPGRPRVGRNIATTAVIMAMYSERSWSALERALLSAHNGDGSGLLALYDSYYQRRSDGTWGNELEAFQTISCADEPERASIAQLESERELYFAAAPRLVPQDSPVGVFCSFFPPSVDVRIPITGRGAGQILVIGTTGDPSTPLESTRRMAAALEQGVLVVVEAEQHTGYNVNRCINDVVTDYLVNLSVPVAGARC
jgi:pimeloyl-ACP methyl ester carboxylesterase